jgi:hypothetical protein
MRFRCEAHGIPAASRNERTIRTHSEAHHPPRVQQGIGAVTTDNDMRRMMTLLSAFVN